MKNYQSSLNKKAFISSLIILIGILLLFFNYFMMKKSYAYDYINKELLSSNKEEEKENEVVEEQIVIEYNEVNNSKEETQENLDSYIGYLTIPKINFSKGFYSKNAPSNNIEENITVMPESNYPDVKNGNMIIIGHSGTGWKAFFNDLYQLTQGDIAIINYNSVEYTYRLVNTYKQEKTGTITIYRNSNKNTLTLITCTNNDATTQTVYIFEIDNTNNNI